MTIIENVKLSDVGHLVLIRFKNLDEDRIPDLGPQR
jgi:hypothetical protein